MNANQGQPADGNPRQRQAQTGPEDVESDADRAIEDEMIEDEAIEDEEAGDKAIEDEAIEDET